MRFRHYLALLVVVLLGVLIFQAFGSNTEDFLTVPSFGNIDIEQRASNNYINKSVNSESRPISYGETNNAETGSANIVTSIIANYRLLDTLGELTVLFIASSGLAFVLKGKKNIKPFENESSFILKTGVKLLFPLLFLLGIYIILFGHLTPGGGFQGGAVIATAILLKFLAYRNYKLNHTGLSILESLAGITFIVLGLISLYTDGSFLTNFLNNGTIGTLFSAGLVPIIYILIGIKVGAELSSVISNLIDA